MIKVAKYTGINRVNLIESNEYGYCSLIKATKKVLDKLDIENRTATKITHKARIDQRLYNPLALREAVINAIIHNDYSKEVPPKFELFSDRLEITSAGGIPHGLNQSEFFEGYSVPRNKEMMRIFKDLEMVEYLGSGMPRILSAYSKDVFIFSENFIRIVFPSSIPITTEVTMEVTTEVTTEVKLLLKVCRGEQSKQELKEALHLKNDEHFRKSYIKPALEGGYIEMTIPDKPQSRLQKYRLTDLGKEMLKSVDRNE